jgi:hypothetical protein
VKVTVIRGDQVPAGSWGLRVRQGLIAGRSAELLVRSAAAGQGQGQEAGGAGLAGSRRAPSYGGL